MFRCKLILLLTIISAVVSAQNRQSRLVHIDMANSLMSGTVNDIVQDRHGLLWVATDMGVSRFDGYNFNGFKMWRKGKDDYNITALAVDKKDDTIYATDIYGETFAINSSSQQTTQLGKRKVVARAKNTDISAEVKEELTLERVPLTVVSCVLKDNCGNTWIGTYGMGLYVLPWRKSVFDITYTEETDGKIETTQAKDKQGNIWTTDRQRRLVKKDAEGKSRVVDIGGDAYGNTVYCLYADKEGTVWIGTYRGLAFVDNGKPRFIEPNRRLENNCVNAICADKDGNIWVGNKKGLARYDTKTRKLTNFDDRDGLPRREFIDGKASIGVDGTVTFFFVGGKVQFNPENVDVAAAMHPLIPAISEIKASDGNKDSIVDTEEDVTLSHDFNTVRINFFVNDLVSKQNVKYSYRLAGYDKGWRGDNKENVAEYSNLPHGDYTFEVRARLRNRDFDDRYTKTIHIVIEPPLWLSWQAKTAYVALFVVLTVMLAWLMKRQIAKRSDERTRLLRKQQEEEFRRKKLELYANITHELRTPLTLIIGPLDDMAADSSLPPSVTTSVVTIRKSAERLLGMVNRLLNFSEGDDVAGEGTRLAVCDVVALVKESVAMVKDLNNNGDLEISFSADDGIAPMETDGEALRTIVGNLVGNALKYTPKGSIEVTLSLDGDQQVCLSVADTGYGIEEQALPHVFEKGYKANGEHQADGSGLGLALVKSLCRRLGGDVAVSSKVNVGTTFTVSLPYRPMPAERNDEKSIFDGSKKTVLVVEDNPEIRRYIVDTLSGEYAILQAADGKIGVEKASEHCPDMIISDVMMPVMDGLEMCKAVKGNMTTSHIPVILLTAKVTMADKENGYDVGADSYITKPFSGRLLLSRIRNIFASRERMSQRLACVVVDSPTAKSSEIEDGLNALDRRFVEELRKTIADNIANEELGVDFIADRMGMSRSTLYRKVKSLTGKSTGSIVDEARLEKAAWLLAHEGATVGEAAYKSGWGDMGNFRQAFKRKYGCLPKDYKIVNN